MKRCIILLIFALCSSCAHQTAAPESTAEVAVVDSDVMPAADIYIAGRSDALVTIHSFIDPASAKFAVLLEQFERLNQEMDGEFRLAVRPSSGLSPAGRDVLIALRAAAQQGKQRETWAALAPWRNGWLTGGAIVLTASLADEIGLDREKFRLAIESGEVAATIDAESAEVGQLPLDGAIAFNGRPYYEMLESKPITVAASETLAGASQVSDQGTPRTQVFAEHTKINSTKKAFGAPFVDSELVPIGKSPTFGNRGGAVKVVAFMDFQCPFSKRAAVTLSQLVSRNPDVELAFKHQPLPFHKQARDAAALSVAAAAQGKFWEMSEQLFLNQHRFAEENWDELSAEFGNNVGADVTRLLADRAAAYPIVDADIALAARLEVSGTPTVLINGERVTGAQPIGTFQEVVQQQGAMLAEMNVPRSHRYAEAVRFNYSKPAPRPEKKPEAPEFAIIPVTDEDPARGADSGFRITIVAFSDYECPFCQRVEPTIKQLLDEHPNDVRFVFKHNPLPFHRSAPGAAAAAIAAGKQGKFWQMHDALFDGEKLPPPDQIDAHTEKLAKKFGLKASKFKKDRAAATTKIKDDQQLAAKVGARGTPTFFINGQRLAGARPYEVFAAIVADELQNADAVAKESGKTGQELYEEILKRRSPKSP